MAAQNNAAQSNPAQNNPAQNTHHNSARLAEEPWKARSAAGPVLHRC
jgi:hypothetical protein